MTLLAVPDRAAIRPAAIRSEAQFQAAFVAWARPIAPLLFHVPNGGARDSRTGGALVAQGVRRGVPDLCLPVARGGFHSLWLELKWGDGATTPQQDRWLAALAAEGHCVAVVRTLAEAQATLTAYLDGRTVRKQAAA